MTENSNLSDLKTSVSGSQSEREAFFVDPAKARRMVLSVRDPIALQIYAEELHQIDPPSALKLMLHIYEAADEAYCHTVADAVSLFIFNEGGAQLCDYLKKVVKITEDVDLKNIYQKWLLHIEKAQTPDDTRRRDK